MMGLLKREQRTKIMLPDFGKCVEEKMLTEL
jgi:hypothetical protein